MVLSQIFLWTQEGEKLAGKNAILKHKVLDMQIRVE